MRLPWSRREASLAGTPKPSPADAPAAEAAASQPDGPAGRTLYAARQPILDLQSRLHGYELLFRGGPENRFDGTDADVASASTIEQGATAFGLEPLVGDRLAFVNLTRRALLAGYHRMLPPERAVIELLETIEPDAEVIAACRAIRAEGYRLALDDYAFAPSSEPLLDLVDLVKVDLRLASDACDPAKLEPLHRRKLTLLAEKVETHEEHRAARAAGYTLFQGYFFCKPEMIQTRDLPPSRVAALRFLAEVSREDVSFERLEALFRQDVALTVRLLRYLNSAAFGWRHEIPSIGHALALMGQRPLRQWAMMMGLLQLADDKPSELSLTALARARFAERIAPPSGLRDHGDELFLGGMLSLMDAMVGRPLPELLGGLAVPDRVRDALLQGQNPLGPALQLVTAYQCGDWQRVDAARSACPVDDRELGEAYVDSLAWAGNVAAA
ncbi:MAG TPA: HDOD domain-containing protein [Candidatus Acidoferrales bacterium]|nr:HDOD domain-containing protein [Candidatus Acidoferrales bacterium]